jgi:hypothetical protein
MLDQILMGCSGQHLDLSDEESSEYDFQLTKEGDRFYRLDSKQKRMRKSTPKPMIPCCSGFSNGVQKLTIEVGQPMFIKNSSVPAIECIVAFDVDEMNI